MRPLPPRLLRCAAVLALWAGVVAAARAETVNVYRIGNSFTWDSAPTVMDAVSANTPVTTHSGYHVRCSSSLATIASDDSTCVAPAAEGVWQEALAGYQWDYLIVQPFIGTNANLTSDTESIRIFLDELHSNPANADTKLLLYQSWPFYAGGPRWEDWLAEANEKTSHRQDYFLDLQAHLAGEGIEVEVIPNADVLYHVIENLDDFDGVTKEFDLYRDALHMSNIGRFVQSMTVLTYLNGVDLTGTPVTSFGDGLTPAERDQFLSLIWDIVGEQLYPGDFNSDALVDQTDYALWRDSYGAQTGVVYDANGDGAVDELDGQLWLDALDPGGADLNEDGASNLADLAVWRDRYGSLLPSDRADANGDGVVDAADYTLWRDEIGRSEAVDFNGDGRVNEQDGALWLSQLGWNVDLPADANHDGVVNAADYTIWRDDMAAHSAPLGVGVPEPGAATLAAAGFALGLLRRRAR